MIRIQGLALYGPLAASTRYRLGQYVPGLAACGIELTIRHLMSDEYLRRRFNNTSVSWASLLHDGWRRFGDLLAQRRFDSNILYGELFPLMPGWAESLLLYRPYIYDFDDAFYLKYRIGTLRFARPMLGDKFDSVIASAAAIAAGNRSLAKFASERNPATKLLPTVVDTDRYLPARRGLRAVFTIGWIGSPSTASYLAQIVGPLSKLGNEGPVRLVVVGGKAPAVRNIEVAEVPWSEQSEVELINSFDVGVMPLPDDDWARGKCAFKLIQYMACAIPVIASRVGANVDVVQLNCGFLVGSDREWLDALRCVRDHATLRAEMGDAGRENVIRHFSLHHNLPILASLIHTVVQKKQ